MALVDCGLLPWPQPVLNSTGVPSLVIDAANEVAGVVFPIYKSGNITAVHWRTVTVTTGATLDIRLETLDATGGLTGTLWGTNTNASKVIADTDDNLWTRSSLTANASVVMGDRIGVAIVNPAASFGNMQLLGAVQAWAVSLQSYPYGLNPDRTTKSTTPLAVILEYTDGTMASVFGTLPLFPVSLAVNTGTNPDEVALYFTNPTQRRVVGWFMMGGVVAGADFRVGLYESGNNTPLVTYTHDGDFVNSTGSRGLAGFFTSSVILKSNTVYRIAILPLTANSVTVRYYEAPSGTPTARKVMGALDAQYSARDRTSTTDPDSAAWTETDSRLLTIGLLYDQEDLGVARIIGG